MRRCCWCCVSLQKGVVAIGVISMICATVLSVGYGTVAVTLEEHRAACIRGEARDLLGILPSCSALSDTSTLLAARIFVYVQVGVWILFLAFSILLIVGAVKERSGLLVPWLVLAGVVTGAVVWAGVRAALQSRTLDLLSCVLAVVVVAYCCLVVRSYTRYIKKQPLVSVLVPSTYAPSRPCWEDSQTPAREEMLSRELPPAYTLHPPSLQKTAIKKKSPLPTGLGIKT
ncbi:hypothetical protein Pmani_016419 [Petrolisthes manimaculis]|uniref:DUF7027 domain-containing protein n=1 Tax=Petrolisthes manimaculis TaxID=1843537 RepID=A0AAE1U8S6_9EUCA|nr:hypothetical protein Pmani_016419 [Petrolisthes manimaculis]